MYKLTKLQSITRLPDGAWIPTDPANTDYAAYLVWLSEGNIPEPADPAPPAPKKQLSSLSYLDLFTDAEQLNIVIASMQNAQVKLWYDKMLAAEYITLADPRTEQGLRVLTQLGLLTDARKVEIVTSMSRGAP